VTGLGRPVAASATECELLPGNVWQIEGKRRIVGHGACGAVLMRVHDASTAKCDVNPATCTAAASRSLSRGA